ncbi:MAG: GNAT family N-acetyltransferase [Thermomicrobium sp.]|nr:GNAT family N-acetyltransferase [Thermomicrobium sp.]MDW8006229.1 GNAT family N-acetyltransferase [Thermomicrobium sp.]
MRQVYPAHREADVVLRDGSTVHVRPVRPEDEGAILAFYQGLSAEARKLRFFGEATDLEQAARDDTRVDYVNDCTLVAEAGPEHRIVGVATYRRLDGDRAEVALAVADAYQGRGLGTILIGHLAEIAESNGIRVFVAWVLPENYRMIQVFRDLGVPVEIRAGIEEIRVTFPTSLTSEAIERFERREQIAAAHALEAVLRPRAVAVIGASRERGTVGGELFHNLLEYGFNGPVFPVNRNARVVQSVLAYPSIESVPEPVDLAVIAVPAPEVPKVAEECGRKGVRALVVISSGFAEIGPEGRARQDELLRICRAYGMRLVGPNCIGVINTDPEVRLNATFGPLPPAAGRVGFASQSGALGLAIIDYARSLGLGLSSFVSMGNKADISGNDLLIYWETDPRTDVILLYLESFGNPRKFARIARRVARKKPIVAVKSGRTSAGVRAASSHTGALLAASDVTVDALFRQTGVIRTETLEGLFDVATLLANQPLPKGRRVAVVTNAGGPGILAVDSCEAHGLEVPELHETTQEQLRALVPPHASVINPVDLTAPATAEVYRRAIPLVANDASVDALIVIYLPPLRVPSEDVARAIVEAAREVNALGKPMAAVFLSSHGVPEALQDSEVRIPSYAFPEAAAIALARAAQYAEWRERPLTPAPDFPDIRRDEAASVIASVLGRGGGWLDPAETARILSCFGIRLVEQELVATPEEAAQAAARLGGLLVLKAVAPGLTHKTERGAVRLGLESPAVVEAAAREMQERLSREGFTALRFLVQRQVVGGVELLVGVTHDRHFGPVVVCGLGGVLVELLRDISVRLTPLAVEDAREMLRELKGFPLLTGYRGSPPVDIAAVEELLLRVSALAEELPDVAELDLNPVIARADGVVVVDARIRIEQAEPPLPLGARTRPWW